MAQSELSALTALYNSTGGSSWSSNQGWVDYISLGSGVDPCATGSYWVGIICTGGAPNHVSYVTSKPLAVSASWRCYCTSAPSLLERGVDVVQRCAQGPVAELQ